MSRAFPPFPPVHNRPGLSALRRRVATWRTFRDALVAALPEQTAGGPDGHRPLARLRTRAPDDPTIALLDAWACVAHVVTFYQERIADEGYLATATQRRSLVELASQVGLALAPATAARVELAFTVDAGPGMPGVLDLPAGARVASVPLGKEERQVFETSEPLHGRQEWDWMALRAHGVVAPRMGDARAVLAATSPLHPGDAVLLVPKDGSPPRLAPRVTAVEPLPAAHGAAAAAVRVTWTPPAVAAPDAPRPECDVHPVRIHAAPLGKDSPHRGISLADAAAAFGGPPGSLFLDAVTPAAAAGGWAVLRHGEEEAVVRILAARDVAVSALDVVARITRIDLASDTPLLARPLGGTLVMLAGPALPPASEPRSDPVGGPANARLVLDRRVAPIAPGRRVALWGRPAGDAASRAAAPASPTAAPAPLDPGPGHEAEIFTVGSCSEEDGLTVLVTDEPLRGTYERRSVRLNANVVPATQGETGREVLGGGDPFVAGASFKLKRKPLTYLSSDDGSGPAPALEVRVDGVRWRRVGSLDRAGPRDRAYVVVLDEAGDAHVKFGDGVHGARLPAGEANVEAEYRAGAGLAGNVRAGGLVTPVTRPLGLKGVTNPTPAAGGADPAAFEAARALVPRGLRTLGRVVTLDDHAAFLRGRPGVGQVSDALLAATGGPVLALTVVPDDGQPLAPGSIFGASLARALAASRAGGPPFLVVGHQAQPFRVAARILADPDHRAEEVIAAARERLAAAYDARRATLGAPVRGVEVAATLQGAPGVLAVALVDLALVGDPEPPREGVPPSVTLHALPARLRPGPDVAADGQGLLVLDPADVRLEPWGDA